MIRYYLTVRTGYTLDNYSVHDIWRFLKNDPNIEKVHCSSAQDLLEFIREHHHNPTICLLVYYYEHRDTFILDILDRVNEYKVFSMKLVFFTFDYWFRPDNPYNDIRKIIYKAKNHHVITFARDLAQLEYLHGTDYAIFQNLLFFNLWCCYASSFIPFNTNPINKICVSGTISPVAYPERMACIRLKNVIRLPIENDEVRTPNNNYSKRLNMYRCCFSSAPHVIVEGIQKRVNTHLLVLKIFEILAAGSLLLCPDTEEPYLNAIGLVSFKNCIIADMNQLSTVIKYITRYRRRIDRIRKEGQDYARKYLNSSVRYKQLLNILDRSFGYPLVGLDASGKVAHEELASRDALFKN